MTVHRRRPRRRLSDGRRRAVRADRPCWAPCSAFAVSICVLSARAGRCSSRCPAARALPALARLRSGWWALIPVGSVVGVRVRRHARFGRRRRAHLPRAGRGAAARRARRSAGRCAARGRWLALARCALFALAWADRGGLAGEAAAVALDALSCVDARRRCSSPSRRALLVKLGIVAMAAADTWLVVSDLLQAPNNALNAAAPVAHLPQLQRAVFGSAVMGYGDLFIAALLGALLASQPRAARCGAALAVGASALAFDLLFFVVDELPATVPIALTLLLSKRRAPSPARRRAA